MSSAIGGQLDLPQQEEDAGHRKVHRRHWPTRDESRFRQLQFGNRDGIQGL